MCDLGDLMIFNTYLRPRREKLFDRYDLLSADSFKRNSIGLQETARSNPSKRREMRAGSEDRPEVVREASDVGSRRANHTKSQQWRLKADDFEHFNSYRHRWSRNGPASTCELV